jgi:hypothetical protein
MEEPCPPGFRGHHVANAIRSQSGHRRIVDDHCQMERSPQRLRTAARLGNQPRHIPFRSDVRRDRPNLHAALAEILDKCLGIRSRRARSAGQQKVPSSAFDQPQRQDLAKPAERPGDQVTAIRLDNETGSERLRPSRYKGLRKRGDDFSNVPAL